MRVLLLKATLFTVLCIFLIAETFSQKRLNLPSHSKILKSQPEKGIGPGKYFTINWDTVDIVKYFANERKNVQYFTFPNKNDTPKVYIDSLLPNLKIYLDNFIARDKGSYPIPERLTNDRFKNVYRKIEAQIKSQAGRKRTL
jgi:hypothetical protein